MKKLDLYYIDLKYIRDLSHTDDNVMSISPQRGKQKTNGGCMKSITSNKISENDQIIIYQTSDGKTQIDVRMENETVWLNAEQMALLFERDSKTIRKHIDNAIWEELAGDVVVAKFATTTQHGAIKGKTQTKEVNYYNLDVIISVGYRVKSKRGVLFRQWANKVLKDYLVKGFAINNKVASLKYDELCKLVKLVGRTANTQEKLTSDEATSLVQVVSDYTYALDTLDDYDYQKLGIRKVTKQACFMATYENAMEAIRSLKKKFGGSTLFGHEKDQSFKSSIGQIYQTFDGIDLYPSVEEKAATLLYLVIKNHSFSDGNKRIAATLFLWFMENNRILYNKDGSKRIADNTLVAITLMIAESRPEEKDMMVKVVVNLINKDNG